MSGKVGQSEMSRLSGNSGRFRTSGLYCLEVRKVSGMSGKLRNFGTTGSGKFGMLGMSEKSGNISNVCDVSNV